MKSKSGGNFIDRFSFSSYGCLQLKAWKIAFEMFWSISISSVFYPLNFEFAEDKTYFFKDKPLVKWSTIFLALVFVFQTLMEFSVYVFALNPYLWYLAEQFIGKSFWIRCWSSNCQFRGGMELIAQNSSFNLTHAAYFRRFAFLEWKGRIDSAI